MKVKIAITSAVLIIPALFFIKILCPDNASNIIIGINHLEINPLSEFTPSYDVLFREYDWSESIKQEIDRNPDDYMIISVSYEVTNKSDKIELKDLNFYPEFSGILKNSVMAFNKDNNTYYIFAEPLNSTGMVQYIIIKSNEQTSSDIRESLLTKKIRMTYFTGNFMVNTGTGYIGIGKHTYEFIIKDVINAHNINL